MISINSLKNRGVEDIFIACTDNLTGFSTAIEAVFPKTERQPLSLEQRHAAYATMLNHLTLLGKHRENLLGRGFLMERIERNQYRNMPEMDRSRRLLAELLRSSGHELLGLPGFRTYYGAWSISGLSPGS